MALHQWVCGLSFAFKDPPTRFQGRFFVPLRVSGRVFVFLKPLSRRVPRGFLYMLGAGGGSMFRPYHKGLFTHAGVHTGVPAQAILFLGVQHILREQAAALTHYGSARWPSQWRSTCFIE